jgi:hypothetical protein
MAVWQVITSHSYKSSALGALDNFLGMSSPRRAQNTRSTSRLRLNLTVSLGAPEEGEPRKRPSRPLPNRPLNAYRIPLQIIQTSQIQTSQIQTSKILVP